MGWKQTYCYNFDSDLPCMAQDIDKWRTNCQGQQNTHRHFDTDYYRRDPVLDKLKNVAYEIEQHERLVLL